MILPPISHICPINFYDDDIFGIPYIRTIPVNCPLRDQLPKSSRTQQFLLSLNNEEPIHAQSAMEEFTKLRTTHANKQISITLSKRNPHATKESYSTQRTKFDQIRPVIATESIPMDDSESTNIPNKIYTSTDTYQDLDTILGYGIPTIHYLTHSVEKPSRPMNGLDCFDPTNTHHIQWKETIFEQYDKNASYQVFTKPIPISTLPPNVDILHSVLAPSVKPTNIPSI